MNLLFFVEAGVTKGSFAKVSPLFVEHALAVHKQHCKIHVAGTHNELENGLITSMQEAGIPMIRLDGLDRHQNFKRHVKQLSEYITNNNINIVHVQSNWQLALVQAVRYYLSFKCKFKIIYTIHAFRNNDPMKSLLARIIICSMLLLFADKVICSSGFLIRKFKLLKYKIIQLPLGIPQLFFGEYKECNIDHLKLIFPAEYRLGKNQDIIIQSFAKFVNETKDLDAHLYLPGTGEFLNQSKNLTKELEIEKQVSFPGQCTKDKLRELYQQANIGVIASNSETFGLCIVEPYCIGRCIITRHVGIADDIIKDGINGYFFKDQEDLTNILLKLNKDKNRLRTIGKYNFKLRDTFNWNNIATQYIKHLQSI